MATIAIPSVAEYGVRPLILMNTQTLQRLPLVMAIGLSSLITASSQITVPKFAATNNWLLSASTQQEVHLVRSLFVETNKAFDEQICESVRSIMKPPITISYQLISFVFIYPTTNGWMASHTELGQPDGLLCTSGGISHTRDFTNDIPLNYVRVVDSDKKEIIAELEVLVSVAPLKDPRAARTMRRSFRFAYRDAWKELE